MDRGPRTAATIITYATLKFLDMMMTYVHVHLGSGVEANGIALFLWETVGYFPSFLILIGVPLIAYFLIRRWSERLAVVVLIADPLIAVISNVSVILGFGMLPGIGEVYTVTEWVAALL